MSRSLFTKVKSDLLDKSKNRWALNKRICGVYPKQFYNQAFAKRFPEEIRRIGYNSLTYENGAKMVGRISDKSFLSWQDKGKLRN